MKYFKLDYIGWKDSQLIYHALAHEGIEALVLSSPKERYVSVGFPQNPREELDMDYCKKENIGIFRRETGGGTVLLDQKQLFYNIVVRKDNPDVPKSPDKFFRKYLEPVIASLDDMKITASYQPLCDLIVENKKISGNGGGEIGNCLVLGGGLLLGFDRDTMSRCLRATPDMRQRFRNMMDKNITTVKEHLGYIPSRAELYGKMEKRFEDLFGSLEPTEVPPEVETRMKELDLKYSSDEWFFNRGTGAGSKEIKVREGVMLLEKRYTVGSRTFSILIETSDGKIKNYELKGNAPHTLYKDLRMMVGSVYERRKVLAMLDDKVARVRL